MSEKIEYDFTLVENLDCIIGTSIPYSYPISGLKDQLMSYNGEMFEYDALGNPTTYRNKTLKWSHGRQLDKFADIAEFTYNVNGVRTSKKIKWLHNEILSKRKSNPYAKRRFK